MDKPMWILEDYAAALLQLEQALEQPSDNDLIKAGCIQYFEFCFELAWKSIKAVSQTTGLPECLSPRACLRQAFSQNWVEEENVWLQMLEARNRMSHTYDAKKALEIYSQLKCFSVALAALLTHLEAEL